MYRCTFIFTHTVYNAACIYRTVIKGRTEMYHRLVIGPYFHCLAHYLHWKILNKVERGFGKSFSAISNQNIKDSY